MEREWEVQKEGELTFDPRFWKMHRAQHIRTLQEALVELITNSDDAYGKNDKDGVLIRVTRRRGGLSGEVEVRDRAGGMTLEEMRERILKYGAFQAKEEARGFMGRAAKDVSALGDVMFASIKDDKIHGVQITTEGKTKEFRSMSARSADYKEFGLKQGKGGTRVRLEVQRTFRVPRHDVLCRDLERHCALRDIVRRRDVRVVDTASDREHVLKYSAPEGKPVADERYAFEDPYKGATARLQLFIAPRELPSELEEGIIVCDEHAIHQVTRFSLDLDQDSVARRFFGRLDCGHIRTLQLEFEHLRSQGQQPPQHNPVDIVDPNRRRGLDRENHPFVKELFSWAEGQLRKQVDQVKRAEPESGRELANEETRQRLRALSSAVAKHFRERLDEEALAPKGPDQEAVLKKEGVLLNPQFSRIALGETRRMGYTVISLGEQDDPEHVTVEADCEGLEVTPKTPELKPQRRNPERLTAYFDVRGIKQTDSVTLTVRHKNELIAPVSRTIEVFQPEDPYANRLDGIFFDNQHYTVHDNGTRTLAFLAKGMRFRTVDWASRQLVDSSDQVAVAILRGNTLRVATAAKDIWRGELQVRGRGVGKGSTITLSVPTMDGLQRATAKVEVSHEEEPPGVSVQIKIVPQSGGQWRAEWARDDPNLLQVFAKHPSLERYLGHEEDKYPGQKQAHVRVMLAEIVAAKVAERILDKRREQNPEDFKEPQRLFFSYSEEMTSFLPTAHRIMVSDSEARNLVTGGGV